MNEDPFHDRIRPLKARKSRWHPEKERQRARDKSSEKGKKEHPNSPQNPKKERLVKPHHLCQGLRIDSRKHESKEDKESEPKMKKERRKMTLLSPLFFAGWFNRVFAHFLVSSTASSIVCLLNMQDLSKSFLYPISILPVSTCFSCLLFSSSSFRSSKPISWL